MTLLLLGLLAGPGAQAAAPGVPGAAVPLYALSRPCQDDRFPRLAGPYVVGCGKRGLVDRVLSLETGELWELDQGLASAGTGEAALYAPGPDGGLWRLTHEGPVPVEEIAVVRQRPLGMPATDGVHLALVDAGHLQAFAASSQARRLVETRAAGWEAPALSWPVVAWTVVDEAGDHDLHWLPDAARGRPEPLAEGPGDQRLVVAQGGWLAWVDRGEVVIHELSTGEQVRPASATGFNAAPALWQGVACWESREEDGDIDLRCSDGRHLDRPGDQLSPGLWGPWLLFHEDGRAWLHTRAAP